ncbi:MAG: LCP family protein [Candidatus Velthaea sp.]
MSEHLAPAQPAGWRRAFPFVFLAAMLAFSVLCGVIATQMVRTHNGNVVTAAIGMFVPPPQTVFAKDRIYLILLGLDYNYDDKDQEYSTGARTDKISVYALDFPTKVVKEIAVPRDMLAIIDGHERKINSAYVEGGEKKTDQVVGEFLGLPKNQAGRYFDRFVTLRINATKDFIDAIGGIDVNVDKKMDYDDNWGHLHIHVLPGLRHMMGEEAVSYARFRHDECGDPCRLKRQQQVVRLAVQKLKTDKFNDLAHITQLIGVINRNVATDLSDDEKRSLAWHFRDINMADLKEDQVAYVDAKDTPYAGNVLIPDEKQKAHLVAAFTGPYAASTAPPPRELLAAISPAQVKIDVENGSGERGMGAKMADVLRKRGFVVHSVSNADAYNYDTTLIREHSKLPGVGERVRSDIGLKTAAVTPAPTPSTSASPTPDATDVTIIVGRDFVSRLAAPPPKSTSPR